MVYSFFIVACGVVIENLCGQLLLKCIYVILNENEFFERGPEILFVKTWGYFKCQVHSVKPFSRLNTPIWNALFAKASDCLYMPNWFSWNKALKVFLVNELISNSFSAIVILKNCRVCFLLVEHLHPPFSSHYRAVREDYHLWKRSYFLATDQNNEIFYRN